MRSQDVLALFDYGYWATWSLLAASSKTPPEAFTAPRTFTWRNLRDTLVHALDVEQSWRRRLQGAAREVWDTELSAEGFSSASELETYWRADAAEMTTWLTSLDDAALAAVVDLGPRDRFPMWFFLVHIVTHGVEQRRDVATILTQLGIEVPELEFLWYADSLKPLDVP
jgi:uncharacterized damage-inducible protein DinB